MTAPLRFCLGLHLHQPVGNFDSVFANHLAEVYQPLLQHLMMGEAWPVAIHVSGPLLDWLEQNATEWVDSLGAHVDAGRVELLVAGHDEPILAVLSRDDRIEQVARFRERLRCRFGVDATGLWLTERVWEPGLPEDLAAAGVRFVLVDDRHFLVTGIPRERLHAPWTTESGGHTVTVMAIDQRLRYLVPFREPSELAEHLRRERAAGHQLAVLADDGEKFGGWPGTAKWVYADGWMERFTGTMRELRDRGEVTFSRFDDAIAAVPSAGLAYLPSASYHEMEGWSLPAAPARALDALEELLGPTVMGSSTGALIRGGHWRHFLAKYPESNRLHKIMLATSRLCRERGDPPAARRHVGRAQCNDAYWHGVFGGLYLPFLRAALWTELAAAERLLRADQPLTLEHGDLDADGHAEVRITSSCWDVVVAPARGGGIEVLLDLVHGRNWADVMTRHEEGYHPADDQGSIDAVEENEPHPHDDQPGGMPSIHDLEGALTERPPIDQEVRAWLVDRIVSPDVTLDEFVAGTVQVLQSWATTPLELHHTDLSDGTATIALVGDGLAKTITFGEDGTLTVAWRWSAPPDGWTEGAWFTTELSAPVLPEIVVTGAERWEYEIVTMAKSEQGFDRTVQGTAVVLRWPAAAGEAQVTVRAVATN